MVIRYRYYVSLPHLHGEFKTALGSLSRVRATDIEDIIARSLDTHLIAQKERPASDAANSETRQRLLERVAGIEVRHDPFEGDGSRTRKQLEARAAGNGLFGCRDRSPKIHPQRLSISAETERPQRSAQKSPQKRTVSKGGTDLRFRRTGWWRSQVSNLHD